MSYFWKRNKLITLGCPLQARFGAGSSSLSLSVVDSINATRKYQLKREDLRLPVENSIQFCNVMNQIFK